MVLTSAPTTQNQRPDHAHPPPSKHQPLPEKDRNSRRCRYRRLCEPKKINHGKLLYGHKPHMVVVVAMVVVGVVVVVTLSLSLSLSGSLILSLVSRLSLYLSLSLSSSAALADLSLSLNILADSSPRRLCSTVLSFACSATRAIACYTHIFTYIHVYSHCLSVCLNIHAHATLWLYPTRFFSFALRGSSALVSYSAALPCLRPCPCRFCNTTCPAKRLTSTVDVGFTPLPFQQRGFRALHM